MNLKAILLLFTLHFIAVQYSRTQSWVNTENRWHVQINCIGNFNSFEVHAFFLQDTMSYNGKIYLQMLETLDSTFKTATPTGNWYREENGKVYILNPQENQPERLIYDFNLTTGDTLRINRGAGEEVLIKVVMVDSVALENGRKHKRLIIQDASSFSDKTAQWIEGVGSDLAPLDTRNMFLSDCQDNMNCFYQQDELSYRWYTQSCSLLGQPVSVGKVKKLKGVKFYPTPTRDLVTVELDKDGQYLCRIFSPSGRKMFEQRLEVGKNLVSLKNFPAGIYLLQLQNFSTLQSTTVKVVKQ